MDNVGYAAQAYPEPKAATPVSPHQSALQELEDKIATLGKDLETLFVRLDPVSHPSSTIESANKATMAAPSASPVPAVAYIHELTRYLESHLAKVKGAIERLAI